MKKNLFVFSLALASLNGFSQENTSRVSYKTNGLWDNWFGNIGGGAAMYFGGQQQKEANLAERLTWGATASVGKWVTPVIGARITAQGGQKHTFNSKGVGKSKIHHMASDHYVSAHIDGLLNFSNLVAGYKEDRVYNFIPYAGVGGATDRKNFRHNSVVVSAGFLNTFRINRNLAISLDISGQAVQSKFNTATSKCAKSYKRQDWDGIGSVSLGLTFGLGGKQNFDRVEDVVFVDNSDQFNALNSRIGQLSSENEYLKRELENAKNNTPAPVETVTTQSVIKDTPYPIQFEINKSNINPSQEIVIYNVAEFIKKNPDTAVEIIGYADKQTGTAAINKALSQKRAQAVENKLLKEYGISKDRIISSWKGDKEQPYPVNNWNRVVVITVVDSSK